jgi:hypothetical protein
MSGNTTIVSSTPGFVVGTYGAKQVRNVVAAHMMNRPGLAARGDFAVTQRGAGANMSVDIAAGGAYVAPSQVTRQGMYYVQSDAAYNTSSDGGYSWTAADATNPRIDLVCLEVKDNAEDASGATGLRFRVIDGTPNASATHQLLTTYWPAIPTGCVPIAAIKIPATDTSISTTDITNLNPLAGPIATRNYIATAESTSGTAMGRLVNSNGTADFGCIYVPSTESVVEVMFKGLFAANVATGNHDIAIFVNDAQVALPRLQAAPTASYSRLTFGTKYTQAATTYTANLSTGASSTGGGISAAANSTTDETFESAPTHFAYASTTSLATTGSFIPITFCTAGWNVIEVRYQASANTVTGKNRTTMVRLAG